MNEFVIEWIRGNPTASVTCPSSSRLANKIRKLAEKNIVVKIVSDQSEALFAHIPIEYVSIRQPRQQELTEEERQKIGERLKKARQQ